jgi:Pectate lyase superfamily protein
MRRRNGNAGKETHVSFQHPRYGFSAGLVVLLAVAVCQLQAATVGATTPFITVEAEAGTLAGGAVKRSLQTIPANALSSPELEASGRSFVELSAAGASVSWTNPVDNANTIVVRNSIPDAPAGGGIDATLDLYVNGTLRQAVALTSKQTIVYDGANGNNNGMSQDPAIGNPHVFYDEARVFITGSPVPQGATIMLKKDPANTAAYYWIDCVDLEAVSPIARPANSLAVTDYGTTGADTIDATNAFKSCFAAAKSQNKTVWIPAGKYYVTELNPNGITMEGAGMWYASLYFTWSQIRGTSCTLRDFCVDARTVQRDEGMGGVNVNGDHWLVERVWAIHGCWAGFWMSGTNGILRDCRSSICWGDGLNMNNGGPGQAAGNMLAENNFTRGCGDDGATIFSDHGDTNTIDGATLRNNTTVGMWWANGMRIAGGKNIRAENNLICDDVKESGMYIGVFGANGSDLDSAVITGNVVLRCGNSRSPGGISLNASPGGKVVKATLSNNTIKDAQFYGILIGSDTVTAHIATDNVIDHPAKTAIYVQSGARGTAYFDGDSLIHRIGGQPAFKNDAASTFTVTFGTNYGFPDTLTTKAVPVPSGTGMRSMSMVVRKNALAVTMDGQAAQSQSVTVYSPRGECIRAVAVSGRDRHCLVPLDHCAPGLYIVKIRNGVNGAESFVHTFLYGTQNDE